LQQVGCLLGALGVYSGQAIGFAAHVELELWNATLVRATFNGAVLPLSCADAEGLCTLAALEDLTSAVRLNETLWLAECGAPDTSAFARWHAH
jgi:hypothetical protein